MLPFDPARYALYLSMMAVMAVTPGPANLFAIATGVRSGPRAALVGVAGMNAATLVWYGAAALGLGALIHAFPLAFRVLGVAGGLYVAWLGVKSLWRNEASLDAVRAAAPGAAFRDGFAVQLANPKIVLFFTAVLPPFVDADRPVVPQLIWLGAATIILDVLAMSAYGVAGGALSSTLQAPGPRRVFAAFVGVILLIAAALILLRH
ncbi:MAG: LysE family translocator [Pseudomonadota bacterium]